ncbi:MAG: TIGR04150 pseudo-rSAM protein [Bacteroidales bacterium]|nr:TIGR04150 pseudo-rSAM protein [Bacteroidales bacterium]
MKNKEFHWLSIEPYVHGVVKTNRALLYNTLNKKYLIIHDQPDITTLISKLLDTNNGRVIKLSSSLLQKTTIKKFIESFRKKYMGDLYSSEWSSGKPFIFAPNPIIKESTFQLQDFLHEVTIHLDSGPNPKMKPWKNAYYQFPFPQIDDTKKKEMDFKLLESLIVQLSPLPIATIHLVGNEVFNYSFWIPLMEMIKNKQFRLKIHSPLSHLEDENLIYSGKHTQVSLLITLPINMIDLRKIEALAQNQVDQSEIEFNFVVQTPEEVATVSEIMKTFKLKNSFFKPYFNGSNLDFFESMVFMNPTDILSSRPGQKQILSRYLLNENDFGRLTVLPDGELFANVNDPRIGILTDTNLADLVKKEWKEGSSWRRIRINQSPCNHCIYQFLCPPVSNYELYLKKFNFCHTVFE